MGGEHGRLYQPVLTLVEVVRKQATDGVITQDLPEAAMLVREMTWRLKHVIRNHVHAMGHLVQLTEAGVNGPRSRPVLGHVIPVHRLATAIVTPHIRLTVVHSASATATIHRTVSWRHVPVLQLSMAVGDFGAPTALVQRLVTPDLNLDTVSATVRNPAQTDTPVSVFLSKQSLVTQSLARVVDPIAQ